MLPTLLTPETPVPDSLVPPRHPFGLPLGTVRGFLSLLICGFFWVVILSPAADAPQPLLAHYFMLILVLLVFSPYAKGTVPEDEGSRWLPRLFRWLVVAGTLAVVALAGVRNPDLLKHRLTPLPAEVQDWWVPMLATVAAAFAAGQGLRVLLGRDNPVFQTLRAWLSVAGMLMLLGEITFWVLIAGADHKPEEFVHYWQAFDLAFIAAYFGTRA